ncbi:DedA family protein [Kurthia senegalensis]|uniref:DedA family protein n=1 Tax=Kurthia senegalensis TaxID=1033740 RepID=UPI000289653F|nr:DedA family protein [Kurthia senegalensis]
METINNLISQYGYYFVFFNLACGLAAIPIPDEALLLAMGYFTKIGSIHYAYALIICFLGSFLGMLLSFTIGKKAGQPLMLKLNKWFRIKQKSNDRIKRLLDRYGHTAILIGCFIPGIRQVFGYFCGTTHIRFKSYVIFTAIGSFAWCILLLTIGRFVGHIN